MAAEADTGVAIDGQNERRIIETGLLQHRLKAFQATPGAKIPGTAEHGDAPVSLVEQMARRRLCRLAMIDADRHVRGLAADIHDLDHGARRLTQEIVNCRVANLAHVNEAGGILGEKEAQLAELVFGIGIGARILDAQIGRAHAILNAANDGEKCMTGQAGGRDADQATVLAGKRPRGKIGHVAHLLDHLQDRIAQLRGDFFRVTQGSGDGDGADARLLGHIRQSHLVLALTTLSST
jgi:hypothetical protein